PKAPPDAISESQNRPLGTPQNACPNRKLSRLGTTDSGENDYIKPPENNTGSMLCAVFTANEIVTLSGLTGNQRKRSCQSEKHGPIAEFAVSMGRGADKRTGLRPHSLGQGRKGDPTSKG